MTRHMADDIGQSSYNIGNLTQQPLAALKAVDRYGFKRSSSLCFPFSSFSYSQGKKPPPSFFSQCLHSVDLGEGKQENGSVLLQEHEM